MTGSASLVSVSVRIAAAAAALLALGVALASCGDTEEDVGPGTAATASEANPKTTPTPESPTAPPTATFGEDEAILPGGYEFSYPDSWNLFVLSDSPYVAKLFLTASPRLDTKEPAELAVFVYENPERVALEEFFNGDKRPNLFKDAAGGYEAFSAGGATGYWFDNVIGLANSTYIALSSDGFVYQLTDPEQKHQSDGVFLHIVSSFKPRDEP